MDEEMSYVRQLQDLRYRLATVERRLQRLKQLTLVGSCAVIVAVLTAQRQGDPRAITAERFVLVDTNGRSRAELSMNVRNDAPTLFLRNAEGHNSAVLSVGERGGSLVLNMPNQNGFARAVLIASPDHLQFGEPIGTIVNMHAGAGGPFIEMFRSVNGQNRRMWRAP